jgi:hypothetical protein
VAPADHHELADEHRLGEAVVRVHQRRSTPGLNSYSSTAATCTPDWPSCGPRRRRSTHRRHGPTTAHSTCTCRWAARSPTPGLARTLGDVGPGRGQDHRPDLPIAIGGVGPGQQTNRSHSENPRKPGTSNRRTQKRTPVRNKGWLTRARHRPLFNTQTRRSATCQEGSTVNTVARGSTVYQRLWGGIGFLAIPQM